MTSQPSAARPGAGSLPGASSTTDEPSRRRGKRRPVGGGRSIVLTIALIACAAYFLLPLVWLVIASTKSNSDLFSTFGLWFADFHLLENLQDVFTFQSGIYASWLRNTILYAVVSGVGAAALATAAGYAFAKLYFPGGNALFAIILGAIMVPLTALAVPTYLLFSKVGLTDTPWAIILPSLVSPFGVYLMRVYAAGAVPDSLLEAARVDGASEARIFFSVVLRLLAPGFVTVLLFALVATWNNYFLPLIMLSEPKWYPLTVGIRQLSSTGILVGSLVAIAPMILAFVLLQRYWRSGLAAGGVNG
jgi:multiple sugar transport system permease protein